MGRIIGNGLSTDIYGSRWILIPHSFLVVSPPTVALDEKVSSLMNANRGWKETLIHSSF